MRVRLRKRGFGSKLLSRRSKHKFLVWNRRSTRRGMRAKQSFRARYK